MKEKDKMMSLKEKIIASLVTAGLFGIVTGVAVHESNTNRKRMQAYQEALSQYIPANTHIVKVGETLGEIAEKMPVYASINGKKVLVPLDLRTTYLTELNKIPTKGRYGYIIHPRQEIKY